MSSINIVRAWKDAEYRNSLSNKELAMLPDNPAGEVVLSDQDLASVVGANSAGFGCSAICHSGVICQSAFCHSVVACNSFLCG